MRRQRVMALLAVAAGCTGLFEPPDGGGVDAAHDASSDVTPDASGDAMPDSSCVPDCEGRECGPDLCGGTCSQGCPERWTCLEDVGVCVCTPECAGRECGTDECGGECGPGCGVGVACDHATGRCVPMECGLGSGAGAPCSGDICEDGTTCYDTGTGGLGVCSASCEDAVACPDIAPGDERCVLAMCIVFCESDADCPCGLSCYAITPLVGQVCVP